MRVGGVFFLQENLAEMYDKGEGIEQDEEKSVIWDEKAENSKTNANMTQSYLDRLSGLN